MKASELIKMVREQGKRIEALEDELMGVSGDGWLDKSGWLWPSLPISHYDSTNTGTTLSGVKNA